MTISPGSLSPEAPVVNNADGGTQSRSEFAAHCFPGNAFLRVSAVLQPGEKKYGYNNWRLIPGYEHINHALVHLFAWLAGDRQDDHMGHFGCRAMMALEQYDTGQFWKINKEAYLESVEGVPEEMLTGWANKPKSEG